MLRRGSNSCTDNHNLTFFIEGATVSVDEMGRWVAGIANFGSEHMQEEFGKDAACAIFRGLARKVGIAKMRDAFAAVRREWIKLNPPNHAGFYYCHIGGEWVHIEAMELDEIVPRSVAPVDMSQPDWQDKVRPACHQHNYQKGSRIVPSVTLEIRPPDEAC